MQIKTRPKQIHIKKDRKEHIRLMYIPKNRTEHIRIMQTHKNGNGTYTQNVYT